jgi:hypothetical protein
MYRTWRTVPVAMLSNSIHEAFSERKGQTFEEEERVGCWAICALVRRRAQDTLV